MATKRELEKKAKDLAAKFAADCQVLFDRDDMTEEVYDGKVMQSLVMAQWWAEEVGAEQ